MKIKDEQNFCSVIQDPNLMNFLAHIYLSGDQEAIMIGNFIGDFVKGKAFENFDGSIQKGILLHRAIDEFTDDHQVVTSSKKRLRPKYHHYAPVIADVFYDHFLASLWENYHEVPLLTFTKDFYKTTDQYLDIIPEKAKHMLHYMRRDNWLYNYQHVEGIHQALSGMSRRTPFDSRMDESVDDLRQDYEAYKREFEIFFPDLIHHSKKIMDQL